MKNANILFIQLLLGLSFGVWMQAASAQDRPATATLVAFEENLGQVQDQAGLARPDVLFSGAAAGLIYHLRQDGISYQLSAPADVPAATLSAGSAESAVQVLETETHLYRVDVTWQGAEAAYRIVRGAVLPGYRHYYNVGPGADPVLRVRRFASLTLEGVWPGVDLAYYGREGRLEGDWLVADPADYSQIAFTIAGAELATDTGGHLIMRTPLGEIREGELRVYQGQTLIPAQWVVTDQEVRFHLPAYDPQQPLRIDPPVFLSGTYFGGSGSDDAMDMAIDNSDNVYLAGSTFSLTSLATTGAHQTTIGGGRDAYLAKFGSDGQLQWATYYGDSGIDQGRACAVDGNGYVYLAGSTTSLNNIATPGAHQAAHGGEVDDAYLVQFDSNGLRQWATYYGGSGDDRGYDCVTDGNGYVYLAGSTWSSDQIGTAGTYQPAIASYYEDLFLVKFNTAGVRQWGTYCGGHSTEELHGCAIDNAGNIYVSGSTLSETMIATPGSHKPNHNAAGWEAFLIKIDATGNRLWGTYYNGSGNSYGTGCATDGAGNVYLIGRSNSPDDIATPGTFQDEKWTFYEHAFLAKFNASGVRQWGTYYGETYAVTCLPRNDGTIYLAGTTAVALSSIASPGAYQETYGGGGDGFIAYFDGGGQRLWGTYLGGSGADYINALGLDGSGNLHVAGETYSPNGIAGSGAFQSSLQGGDDAFWISFEGPGPLPVTWVAFSATPVPEGVSLEWTTAAAWHQAAFVVQRSRDGQQFEDLATLEDTGAGGYEYVDLTPYAGISYYRLTQVDLDGRIDYSELRMVNLATPALQVYPNPTLGEVTLRPGPMESPLTLVVYNPLGQVVYEARHDEVPLVISLPAQPGLYLLELTSRRGAKSWARVLRF